MDNKIRKFKYGTRHLNGYEIISLAKTALSEGRVIEIILDFDDSYSMAEVRHFFNELAEVRQAIILNRTFRCDRLIHEFNMDSWIMETMGYEPIVSP